MNPALTSGRRRPRWVRRSLFISLGLFTIAFISLAAWAFDFNRRDPFPTRKLEVWPQSPRVIDRNGETMLEIVGRDDQWRRPVALDAISPWLVQATLAIEDERFYRHPGVDPIAVARAAMQNLRAGGVVSGASTLSMQVCRMLEPRSRTWGAKLHESMRALQLERLMGKDAILEAYLNLAPYGGNVRGVESASLEYFGRHAADLSLAEAALIAGLPQAPARLEPRRHSAAALARRDLILGRMLELRMIGQAAFDLATSTPLHLRRPERAIRAPHASWLALARRPLGGRTTIDLGAQAEVESLVAGHARTLPAGSNLSVVVLDVERRDILAMVGSRDFSAKEEGQVNGALARRSPGSALKPFIYAAAFETGRLGPQSPILDAPLTRAGWSPGNFNEEFSGVVTAAEALRRSLNTPAIRVAETTGLARCSGLIDSAGVRLPSLSQSRGGLALAVGAIEVRLVDLVNGYATLGAGGIAIQPRLFVDEPREGVRIMGTETCARIDEVLSTRHRLPRGGLGISVGRLPWFMWKTGTSAGRRDAWAVGHNRHYAIGVWVGRFSGAGDVAYVGAEASETLLTSLFSLHRFRNDVAPPAPEPRALTATPLPVLGGGDEEVRIESPSPGATFLALGGRAVIHPEASHAGELFWFLNGELLPKGQFSRLELTPGSYNLRCASPEGNSAAVTFTVR